MIDSITKYWYLWLILIFAVVFVVFIWKKAIASARANSRERSETIADMKHWNELQKKYERISQNILESLNGKELFEATLANIFATLAKGENELDQWKLLTDEQKNVYAAWFDIQDMINGGVRNFFNYCSDVLGTHSYECMYAIGYKNMGDIIKRAYDCFDPDNLSASFDENAIEQLNKAVREGFDETVFLSYMTDYIHSNAVALAQK